MTRSLPVTFNALGLYAIALVLLVAFAAQLVLHELPCPLCLLQRIQFALLAVGPFLNIRFGLRPSHYALSLLTAVAGAAFAARQILLRVMPGDPGYGSALLGYHYYTWAFIGFAVAIVAVAAMLLFDSQFKEGTKPEPMGAFAQAAVLLVLALTSLNVISTLLECGFAACQPARLRTAQAKIVRAAITLPQLFSVTSVPEWDRQFRLVRVPPRTPRGTWPASSCWSWR